MRPILRKGMSSMQIYRNRKFELASEEARAYVDLQDYKNLIEATVWEIVPGAKVAVAQSYFVVDVITRGQTQKLGRALSKTKPVKHCLLVCRLFTGSTATELERIEWNENRKHQNVHRNH